MWREASLRLMGLWVGQRIGEGVGWIFRIVCKLVTLVGGILCIKELISSCEECAGQALFFELQSSLMARTSIKPKLRKKSRKEIVPTQNNTIQQPHREFRTVSNIHLCPSIQNRGPQSVSKAGHSSTLTRKSKFIEKDGKKRKKKTRKESLIGERFDEAYSGW